MSVERRWWAGLQPALVSSWLLTMPGAWSGSRKCGWMPWVLWSFPISLPAVISLTAMTEPHRCSFLLLVFFSSGFLLEHFFVCLMPRGPRANNISKPFCRNFECQNN